MFDKDKAEFDSNLIVDHKKRVVTGVRAGDSFDKSIEIRRLVYEMIQDPDIFTDMACEGHLNEEEKPYVMFCTRTQEKGLWLIQQAKKFGLVGSSINDDVMMTYSVGKLLQILLRMKKNYSKPETAF